MRHVACRPAARAAAPRGLARRRPAQGAAGGRADARSGQVAAAAARRPGRQDLDRARDPQPSGRGRSTRRVRATRVRRDRGRHHLRGWSGRLEGAGAMPWRRQFPTCRGELVAAEARLFADLESTGWLRVLLLLAVFVGFGYGCERVFRLATAAFRERLMASPLDTPAARGRAVLARLLYGLALVLTFAAGQHRRLPRLLLAGQPPRRGPGLSAGLPGAAGGNDRRAVPVRAAEPPLSRGADGRRRGLALVPLDGGLRRLVRVRLRHHPAAAPLRRRPSPQSRSSPTCSGSACSPSCCV